MFLEGSCRIFVSDIWTGLGKVKQNGETKFKRDIQEMWTRLGEEERWEKIRTDTGRVSITEDGTEPLVFKNTAGELEPDCVGVVPRIQGEA